ncbi:unnamed protein product, partial [marine sediment metagenome]
EPAPNPTFATVSGYATPSTKINIGWERNPNIENSHLSGTDAIHVTTSIATLDYAMVIVPTNFTLSNTSTISYWGYTENGSDVKAPDEIFLFLEKGEDVSILTSHKPGGAASEYYGKWDNWSLSDTANQWHTVNPYAVANLADYIDNGYTVLAIALTAGPSVTSGAVNVDVYFDNLTVDGEVLLDDDTGTIEVPEPIGGFPAPSIQDAIDAALPGDTVLVGPGTYGESITINKENLTIISDTGDYRTTGVILKGTIGIGADNVKVQGFKFQDISAAGYKHVIYTSEPTANYVTIDANSF